ncbi:MAG: hypothetical protein A4E62_00559 [Syntrophorhabdus sp. PtaU1.Bin002]|nr:MAG: hypothetical protein A4E62_00559 [Syntrophorhabdus sp. PtaU1.Bin002]
MDVYFSDIFDVDPAVIEGYGAFNISLINDLPLFVDPFLLFNSEKEEYQALHRQILEYVGFLREKSIEEGIHPGLLKSWFLFSEVKQNWFGYSLSGNGGSGLGIDFAKALNKNLHVLFTDFGKETITRSSHLEKLCLVKDGVGRDNISDFTVNLIKGYLLEYTQAFARKYIDGAKCKNVPIPRVSFNYGTESWKTETFYLPLYNGDFVLLTPKDILTKDETWINKIDIIGDFHDIVASVSNEELRGQMNHYFISNLPHPERTKRGAQRAPKKKEIAAAISAVISKYPVFIDYYIRYKEEHGDDAKSISKEKVLETQKLFVTELSGFIESLFRDSDFYETSGDTLEESYQRVQFLKHVIEDKDGYRIFYQKGQPVKREVDLQIMFRLTWYATPSDVTREANEGRGPVDFKISRGAADKSLVEFKLASNSKLKQNLEKQVEIYKKAHDTDKAIKVILFFTEEEEMKTRKVLSELDLLDEKYVVLIDARNDNKPSASKA